MRVPLLADEVNELSMFPGKFYQYAVKTTWTWSHLELQGEPLWKTPGWCTESKNILTHIPKGKPFMFINLEVEDVAERQNFGSGKRCWLKVIYGEFVGFINVSTFCLHDLIEPGA